jgi:hypothetical protein
MRIAAITLAAMWAVEAFFVGMSVAVLISSGSYAAGAWLWLSLHVAVALAGVASGILFFYRKPSWRWFAIASSLALLAITDFQWFSIFTKASSVREALLFFLGHPKIGFGVILMPVFSVLVLFLALFHLTQEKARAR